MSKQVKIGNLFIGGGNKIAIQSMSTDKISDTVRAIELATSLQKAGCDILRFSVLDDNDAKAFSIVKKQVNMPLVADIHFDYRLALKSIDGGADKIRINPGNIGGERFVAEVAQALKSNGIPVRVGSNSGSIEKEFLGKYGVSATALGESALKHVSTLERHGVQDIVVSVKASSVKTMVEAYEYISKRTDYPLHLGVTEAGTEYNGVVKNSIGIGALLLKGIGDTLRVSLSAHPEREIVAGKSILKSVGLLEEGAEVIACPTCGRCAWDCMEFAKKTEDYVKNVKKPLKIAVMGCVVNGPGEASNADVGVAGGKDKCVIFSHGKILKTVDRSELEKEFFGEIDRCLEK